MNTINKNPFQPHSASQTLAEQLGLSPEEYALLSHGPLHEVRDINNNIIHYYIEISPLNPETILAKLNMNKDRIIYLSAPPTST